MATGPASSSARRIQDILELNWLTGKRIAPYALLVGVLYVLAIGNGIIWSLDASGPRALVDFRALWAAGLLARQGNAASAYDWDVLHQAMVEALGDTPPRALGWLNPPTFFFVVAPLSVLPYRVSWTVWLLISLAVFAAASWVVLPRVAGVVAGLLTPAALLCASIGQNGFLTASLFAFTLAWLDRRPVAAGICLGLLTYKPQFGLLFPLLLIIGRRWRAFGAAAVTGVALAGASVAMFGSDSWAAFFRSIGPNADVMLGAAAALKMQSVYSLVTRLGGSQWLAAVAHAAIALPAAAMAIRLSRAATARQRDAGAVAMMAASFLLTPYTHVYDAVALAVAALFLVRSALRDGFQPFERLLIVLSCSLPGLFVFRNINVITPVAWLVMLFLARRQARLAVST